MKTLRFLLGSVVIASLLAVAPAAFADDEGGGRGGPFNQDPGTGGAGSGGDPCAISQKGYCRSMTIYPGGYWCQAGWCEPDPAAFFKCASYNTMSCEQGTNPDGSINYVMVNDCASCWD